ncbi:hypothetical protein BD408DRAFT_338773 [Parasitella parasitica]|nr:hypothetical protein BD408DRAFT_338773 [Parasitella parasitica]
MSKYEDASITTTKKVKIYSVHTIQTKISLMCYQLKDAQKWSCYECFSAEMPLLWSKRSLLLPVLEIFGFLHQELIQQEQVYAELLKESLGIVNAKENKISSFFNIVV